MKILHVIDLPLKFKRDCPSAGIAYLSCLSVYPFAAAESPVKPRISLRATTARRVVLLHLISAGYQPCEATGAHHPG